MHFLLSSIYSNLSFNFYSLFLYQETNDAPKKKNQGQKTTYTWLMIYMEKLKIWKTTWSIVYLDQ